MTALTLIAAHVPHQVVSLIDDTRTSIYSSRMKDVFNLEDVEVKATPLTQKLKKNLLRSPAERAAEKAAEIAAEIQAEIIELEDEIEGKEQEEECGTGFEGEDAVEAGGAAGA